MENYLFVETYNWLPFFIKLVNKFLLTLVDINFVKERILNEEMYVCMFVCLSV